MNHRSYAPPTTATCTRLTDEIAVSSKMDCVRINIREIQPYCHMFQPYLDLDVDEESVLHQDLWLADVSEW